MPEMIPRGEPTPEDILVSTIESTRTEINRLRELIEREFDAPDIEEQKEALLREESNLSDLSNRLAELQGQRISDDDTGQGEMLKQTLI